MWRIDCTVDDLWETPAVYRWRDRRSRAMDCFKVVKPSERTAEDVCGEPMSMVTRITIPM